jgi:hypothetical protein
MDAPQYHLQFPSDAEARRFVYLVAWSLSDVAIQREDCWVSVIDGHGDREQIILTLALRVTGEDR